MKIRNGSFAAALFACTTILVAACGATGPRSPAYTSPLAGITDADLSKLSDQVKIVDPKKLSLGLFVSKNTEASVVFMEAGKRYMEGFALPNTIAIEDLDAKHILHGAVNVLKTRFGSVQSAKTVPELAERSLDLGVILDFQLEVGRTTGETTSVSINGIFLDRFGRPMASVKGSGSETIGYPAFSNGFKSASDAAVNSFTKKLDTVLTGF